MRLSAMSAMGVFAIGCLFAGGGSVLASVPPNGSGDTGQVVEESTGAFAELPVRVVGGGRSGVPGFALRGGVSEFLFEDSEGRVAYLGRGVQQQVDAETVKPGGSHFGVHALPEGTFLTWWQKRDDGGKHLYVRRVSEVQGESGPEVGFEPVVTVNTGSGVLPTYRVVSNGSGRVAIVYHDERVARYGIYGNVSVDGGRTWRPEDMRIDVSRPRRASFAIEPHAVFSGDRLVVTWRDDGAGEFDGTRYMARVLDTTSMEWAEPAELGRFEGGFFTSDVILEAGGVLLALGAQTWDHTGLTGYRSTDAGATWELLEPLPGTGGLRDVSQLQAVAHNGVATVLFSWQYDGENEIGRQFNYRIGAGRLDLGTGEWLGEFVRVDEGKMPDLTTSLNPTLVVTESGVLVAAWEDRREIRANAYLSRSHDGGVTWSQPVAFPLGADARSNPSLIADGDAVHLVVMKLLGDRANVRSMQIADLGPEAQRIAELTEPGLPPGTEDEVLGRLRERAEAFWRLRTEQDFAAAYDFLDPAYRAMVSREVYVRGQGQIRFLDFEIAAVQATGRFGGSLTKMTAAIPRTVLSGEEFELEPREDWVPQEWVWVDDDWHLVFGRASGGGRVLRY